MVQILAADEGVAYVIGICDLYAGWFFFFFGMMAGHWRSQGPEQGHYANFIPALCC